MKIHKYKMWYVGTCMTIIVIGFGFSLYEQYYPIKIIDIHSPLKILTPIVRPGEVMVYLGDFCLYKKYPATVYRTLVDDTIIQLPIVNSVGVLGCRTIHVQVPIPEGSLPGVYHLEGITSYKITPTRNIDVPFYTDKFTIQ